MPRMFGQMAFNSSAQTQPFADGFDVELVNPLVRLSCSPTKRRRHFQPTTLVAAAAESLAGLVRTGVYQ